MSITALAAAEREYKPIGLGDRQERCSSSALHVCLKRPVDAKSTK